MWLIRVVAINFSEEILNNIVVTKLDSVIKRIIAKIISNIIISTVIKE